VRAAPGPSAEASPSTVPALADAGAGSTVRACEPSASTACFHDAEIEHAVMLLARHHRVPAVVVGAYAARIDGPVAGLTARDAFTALASSARASGAVVTSDALDGVHRLRPLTAPPGPAPLAKAPPGCTRPMGLSFQRTDIERVLSTVAERQLLASEPSTSSARLGKMSVFVESADVCTLLARAIEVTGGKLLHAGGKLVAARADAAATDRARPGDAVEREAPACSVGAPSEFVTHLACWSVAELELVGVTGPPEAPLAVARARPGRAAFTPGALVRVGDRVGREGVRVARIDALGLHGERGELVGVAPSAAR
jgi:hypothetical protein